MKNIDGEVKFSFWEILFSPFITIKNMVKSKSDVSDGELDIKSSNKIESELAKSSEEIDKKVSRYGGTSKAQRNQLLSENRVAPEKLQPLKHEEKVNSKEIDDQELTH